MTPERIYRLLLHAYPPQFRAQYEREMVLLFRDQCREHDTRSLGFWAAVSWDVVRSAPALRLEALGSRSDNTRTSEVRMRFAAVVTVLLGAFGTLGAVMEWMAGMRLGVTGTHGPAVVLATCAYVLLVAAGVALFSRTPRARQTARLVLFVALVLFGVSKLLFPWMGYFAQLVGFGTPVGLLIALYWPRRGSPAAA